MYSILFDNLIPAITWTLIHSLWQGLILSILASLVLLLTRQSTAARRYALLCGMFFLFLCCVSLTFFIEWNTGIKAASQNYTGLYLETPFLVLSPLRQLIESISSFFNANALWIVLAWFIVFLFKSDKMIREMGHIKNLRRYKAHETEEYWICKVQALANELGIRKPVLLIESALVKVPIIMGHFKPLILVPMGMLNQMPPAQVEAVLLHELAHIRRHDYLVNFIQRLSELVFFFNPALLWVSSLLRAEREVCCDEITISHTGNKIQFVEALIHCKEYSMRTPTYALGFFGPKKLLLHRLNRILSNNNKMLSRYETAFFVISILLLTGLVLGKGRGETSARSAQSVPMAQVRPKPVGPITKTPLQIYVNEITKAPVNSTRIAVDVDRKRLQEEPPQAEKDHALYQSELKDSKRVEVSIVSNSD